MYRPNITGFFMGNFEHPKILSVLSQKVKIYSKKNEVRK